jgi:hypothetical protein
MSASGRTMGVPGDAEVAAVLFDHGCAGEDHDAAGLGVYDPDLGDSHIEIIANHFMHPGHAVFR